MPKPLEIPQLRMTFQKWLPQRTDYHVCLWFCEDDWKAIDDKTPLLDGLIVEVEGYINR